MEFSTFMGEYLDEVPYEIKQSFGSLETLLTQMTNGYSPAYIKIIKGS
jgi:hypothetical protein